MNNETSFKMISKLKKDKEPKKNLLETNTGKVILYQEFDEVIKIDNQDDKKVVTVKND
jgi:hypothetical protein